MKKSYRNACDFYYIEIYPNKMCDRLLESIGDNTHGGHSYGYKITYREIKELPAGVKFLEKTKKIMIY